MHPIRVSAGGKEFILHVCVITKEGQVAGFQLVAYEEVHGDSQGQLHFPNDFLVTHEPFGKEH